MARTQQKALTRSLVDKRDPSRTGAIRRAYEAEFLRRLNRVKKILMQAIVTQDALGLAEPKLRAAQIGPPGFRKFAGLTPADKTAAFGAWLRRLVDDQLLEAADMVGPVEPGGWTRQFIRRGFMQGILSTMTELRKSGRDLGDAKAERLFTSPFHRRQLETLYSVNLESLKNMSSDMAGKIRQKVGVGLIAGKNPREMARDIAGIMDISANRSRMIARTECIRANSEGTLATFRAFGESGVQLQAEWLTAGDDGRRCDTCAEMEGKVFSIEEAHGMIPLHPNPRSPSPIGGGGVGTEIVDVTGFRCNKDKNLYRPARNGFQQKNEIQCFSFIA